MALSAAQMVCLVRCIFVHTNIRKVMFANCTVPATCIIIICSNFWPHPKNHSTAGLKRNISNDNFLRKNGLPGTSHYHQRRDDPIILENHAQVIYLYRT